MLDRETVEECVRKAFKNEGLVTFITELLCSHVLPTFTREELELEQVKLTFTTVVRDYVKSMCRERGEECSEDQINELARCLLSRATSRRIGRFMLDSSSLSRKAVSSLCAGDVYTCLEELERELEEGKTSMDRIVTAIASTIITVLVSEEGVRPLFELEIADRYVKQDGTPLLVTESGIVIELSGDRAIFILSEDTYTTHGKVQVDSHRHGRKTRKPHTTARTDREHADSEGSAEVEEWEED